MDHYGGDIKCVSAATYIECNDICMKEAKCRRWTLSMRHDYKKCFLKREETENENDPIGDRCNSFTGFKNLESRFCDTNGRGRIMKVVNIKKRYSLYHELAISNVSF